MGLNRTPAAGQTWKHFKGGVYEIICKALREEDLIPVVVYRHVGAVRTWVRPLDNFLGTTMKEGRYSHCLVDRFERVS